MMNATGPHLLLPYAACWLAIYNSRLAFTQWCRGCTMSGWGRATEITGWSLLSVHLLLCTMQSPVV